MITTKIYKNTGKEDVNVIGIGIIPANNQVSITSEFHQPVVLANYPTVVELTGDQNNG